MQKKHRWFSVLYCTRIKVFKGQVPILNLSLLFMLLAVGSAPWVGVVGLIAALALGYRFCVERNSPDFCGDFDTVMQDAAQNVHHVMDGLKDSEE